MKVDLNALKEWAAALLHRAASYLRSDSAKRDLERIADYVPKAIPIIDIVATIGVGITPTKLDDGALVWLHTKYPRLFDGSIVTSSDMKLYLLGAATDLMRQKYPSLTVSEARAAIQVAYVGVKSEEQSLKVSKQDS